MATRGICLTCGDCHWCNNPRRPAPSPQRPPSLTGSVKITLISSPFWHTTWTVYSTYHVDFHQRMWLKYKQMAVNPTQKAIGKWAASGWSINLVYRNVTFLQPVCWGFGVHIELHHNVFRYRAPYQNSNLHVGVIYIPLVWTHQPNFAANLRANNTLCNLRRNFARISGKLVDLRCCMYFFFPVLKHKNYNMFEKRFHLLTLVLLSTKCVY